VSEEKINAALDALNKFIAAQSANASEVNTVNALSTMRLESFTLEEMSKIVDKTVVDRIPINVLALSLVNLKRLDICTESSIRVYKVRRFY
jgi:hypothetical protein